MVVDLPAPFGPRNPKNCPAVTCRSTLSTAVSPPNCRVSFSVTIAISLMIRLSLHTRGENSTMSKYVHRSQQISVNGMVRPDGQDVLVRERARANLGSESLRR